MIRVSNEFIALLDVVKEKTSQGRDCAFRLVRSGPSETELNGYGVATDFRTPTGEYEAIEIGPYQLLIPRAIFEANQGKRLVLTGPNGIAFEK